MNYKCAGSDASLSLRHTVPKTVAPTVPQVSSNHRKTNLFSTAHSHNYQAKKRQLYCAPASAAESLHVGVYLIISASGLISQRLVMTHHPANVFSFAVTPIGRSSGGIMSHTIDGTE